jgi:endonuclease III
MTASNLSVVQVIEELGTLYPDADCTLDWSTPLELLVAAILSAQCTDAQVNNVTKVLFQKYRSPGDYIAVTTQELEQDIHSCGTFHMKAVAIRESCSCIIDEFDGEVPQTMNEMLRLRGVGRKTASVVLGTAYGVVEGIPIDTHNMRLLQRLGLTQEQEQHRIELDMMQKTPRTHWLKLSHLLIAHGRAVCTAKKPDCAHCIFSQRCSSSSVRP